MHDKYGIKVYSKYGFIDAFNPGTGWFDSDVLGINTGIILLSAENSLTGNVWKWFMQNREIPLAMQKAGLVRSKSRTTSRTGERFGSPRHQVKAMAEQRPVSLPPVAEPAHQVAKAA